MVSINTETRSNGYSKRRFWHGCYSQSSSSFSLIMPAADVEGSIVWCPKTKKYYSGNKVNNYGNAKIYSRTPGGLWTLVHTGAGNGLGLFWSRRLGMLVYFTTTHIYTSVDGVTWVSQTVPSGYSQTSMLSFCDATTYTLFSGNNNMITSDGVTWARGTSGVNAQRLGCISGSDTIVGAVENGSSGFIWYYTSSGTATTMIVNNARMDGYFPPTPLRQEHWYNVNGTLYRSTDGITYSVANCDLRSGETSTAGPSFVFGGVMFNSISEATATGFDFLNYASSVKKFSSVASSIYVSLPNAAMTTVQGEYLSANAFSYSWNPRPVGTWLEPGDYMCILIGGGGQNISTTVGGCAGAMVRHKFTVTEKHRWIAYNIAGATAIVDVGGSDGLQADNFLAYASFSAYNAQPGPNQACFGDEVYYGMPALQQSGAACGPSGGYPSYRGISSTAYGCGTTSTTTATTPNDWWDPEDWVGNPAGTGYPGTSGSTAATIGMFGSAIGVDSAGINSYGSGGTHTGSAFANKGGQPLVIIYSN